MTIFRVCKILGVDLCILAVRTTIIGFLTFMVIMFFLSCSPKENESDYGMIESITIIKYYIPHPEGKVYKIRNKSQLKLICEWVESFPQLDTKKVGAVTPSITVELYFSNIPSPSVFYFYTRIDRAGQHLGNITPSDMQKLLEIIDVSTKSSEYQKGVQKHERNF